MLGNRNMRLPEALIKKAISLADLGVADLAWTRLDVFEIIKELSDPNVAVLGGDVLKKEDAKYKYTYDNWHCDIRQGEEWDDYAKRSRKETEEYLKIYPDTGDNVYVYSLVFTDKPDAGQLRQIHKH